MSAAASGMSPLFVVALALTAGCDHKSTAIPRAERQATTKAANHLTVKPVAFYEQKLLDKTFRWYGPCSRQDRIPVLHAARALAYIGDPAVPALFRAARNKSIDSRSVWDALSEIGLPVIRYWDDPDHPDPSALERLEQWWIENQEKTAVARSDFRVGIGLPPVKSK
jgi:hypothetical protein